MTTGAAENITDSSVTLNGEISSRDDTSISTANIGFQYREQGSSTWSRLDVSTVDLDAINFPYTYTGNVSGLNPGTTYEYRAFAEDPNA